MGRPSLAEERVQQILDAYTRCVARFGLDGATLGHVSEESGFSRGHVRHYVGNRDELRDLFQKRLVRRYVDRAREVVDAGQQGRHSEALVGYLFGRETSPGDDDAAIDAILAAARFDDDLRGQVRAGYRALEDTIRRALRSDFPGAERGVYRDAAYQVLALAYGHWSLQAVGFPASHTRSVQQLALELVEGVRIEPRRGRRQSPVTSST